MSNGRIVKNTIILYVRMVILMITSLYTSRIILSALGVEDFGIYNVVGGIVVILGFLNGALSTASSRYITVALSTGDLLKMQRNFSNVLLVNGLLGIIIFILGETAGLWFLYNKMEIPTGRLYAALWVYQISIITVILNIVSVPYNAMIIAHERMKAFAYISLFDAFGKLLLAFLLERLLGYDRLIMYALFVFMIQLIDRIFYGSYCRRKFKETHFSFCFNKSELKEIFQFISWSAYGSFASAGFTQGLNILLNLFFGPTVNAARGISVQVQNAVVSFTTNFQTAINPQIIKSVAQGNISDTCHLMISSSKYSFYLLCILGLPIIAETHYILSLWLENVPDYSVQFVKIMLVISIWSSLANPLRIVNQAEGNIKKFQLYECSVLLLIVPLSYFGLKMWKFPELVFFVQLIIELLVQVIRLKLVLPKIHMSLSKYAKEIYLRIIPVFLFPFVSIFLFQGIEESFLRLCLSFICMEILMFTLIYYWGMTTNERSFVTNNIIDTLKKK